MLAGSVVFHIAILTPLALRFFEEPLVPRRDEDPAIPIYLDIEPRPLLPGEVARTRVPVARPAGPVAPLDQVRAGQSILPGTQRRTEETPSTPAPRIAAGAPASAPAAPADAWRLTPESQSAAVARSLRTGAAGCRAMDGRLTASEQQLCDDRFNAAAGQAGPLGPRTLNAAEARREAGFARGGAQALAQHAARRRRLSGGVGILGPGDCPGSNLGVGCAGAHLDPAIRQGATTTANPGLGSNDQTPMRPIAGQD
ncbi:hypothetical protein BZG35_12620 [Brevundimonas sp. LM2]|nr:hypothetical protein BZG35_12620 [Brevundimonas sp. LM2]